MIRISWSFAIALGIAACTKSPDSKSTGNPPANDGKRCGTGASSIVCPRGTFCGHGPAPTKPIGGDAEKPPNGPSYQGGACGGVAGFHCADGLVCEMPADQENVADGMGTCGLPWTCVNGFE